MPLIFTGENIACRQPMEPYLRTCKLVLHLRAVDIVRSWGVHTVVCGVEKFWNMSKFKLHIFMRTIHPFHSHSWNTAAGRRMHGVYGTTDSILVCIDLEVCFEEFCGTSETFAIGMLSSIRRKFAISTQSPFAGKLTVSALCFNETWVVLKYWFYIFPKKHAMVV